MVRLSVFMLSAVALVGCASKPAQPPVTKQVPVDASNVAEVQKAGYRLVNKNGEKLYCRTDPITGSRLQTRTQCLTEQELYDQMHQTQQTMSWATSNHYAPQGK